MRKLLCAVAVLLIPAFSFAAERAERPHWTLELKGGVVFPDVAQWSRFYGSSFMGEYGAAFSYKVHRLLDVGVEATYARSKGKGSQSEHGVVADSEVTHQQVPVNVFLLVRGVADEKQWVVPYVGGGYTRMFFRQEVKGQGRAQGSVNGFHARGGLQFLLDRMEPEAAESLSRDFGLDHSYFFVEGRYTRAMADTVAADSVNIGGSSCLGGFLFEF